MITGTKAKTALKRYKRLTKIKRILSVADPEFELRRGPVLFYLPSRLLFLQPFQFFFTQNKGDPRASPLDPPQFIRNCRRKCECFAWDTSGFTTYMLFYPLHQLVEEVNGIHCRTDLTPSQLLSVPLCGETDQ